MLLNIHCGPLACPAWLNQNRMPSALAWATPLVGNAVDSCHGFEVLKELTRTAADGCIAEQMRVPRPNFVSRRVEPCESRIAGLASFTLDATDADAPPRKPDSLYVEAIKAAA